ncbi:hypothetical protein [Thermoflavimicrobium dichotomicum]|uniref:Uncharacterized protein n=1 Tax=Thermoflavimicrobium dichotomicum TaxID=46223 RepID=A0A1I3RZI4_9BACL|nr:hypothetical protein [Thermoflavimicrobium dichotomicum]SFJ52054.1 hypothetical protein SAMN05421852_111109 [Thermoflavimicrobium dichotomicum]
MEKKVSEEKKPTIAPGMNDQEELEERATKKEIARGDYTKVTTLSFDEVDPS